MWIVAIGWSYVVILMAATETSFVAGMMTFLVYCMIPLSILFYLTGGKRRRAKRAAAAARTQGGPGDGLPFMLPQWSVAENTHMAEGAGVAASCDNGSDSGGGDACGGDGGGGGGD